MPVPKALRLVCTFIACAAIAGACTRTAPSVAPSAGATAVAPRAVIDAERLAAGGRAWDRIGALVIDGTVTEGGVPGKFEKVIDLRTGFSRTVQDMGTKTATSGYDGIGWVSSNGIVNSVDLPPLVEDARSKAFVDRAGWRQPAVAGKETARLIDNPDSHSVTIAVRPDGGSDVEITFDRGTHLVTRVVIETDDGPLVTTLGDWRSVGPIRYPFRQDQTDNTGEQTLIRVGRVHLESRADPGALARPKPAPHGRLTAGAASTTAFTLIGSRQSHILVPANVSGIDTHLIFDTGAANYFWPESAKRFGLTVSGGLNLSGVGESSTTGGFATADRITIGSAELRDETVVVGPRPFPSNSGQGKEPVIDGFTGFEFLYEFRTTIDYPARTITFAALDGAPPAGGIRVPFFSDGHSIYVEAAVDGYPGLFRLDTGASGALTLFPAFAAQHRLDQETGPATASGGGIGGQVTSRPVTLSHFSLAGMTFDNLAANLSQNKTGAFTSRSLAGNLGAGVLRCYSITFDYPARMLTFDPRPETDHCGRV
jgi:predicted aspartyl protease